MEDSNWYDALLAARSGGGFKAKVSYIYVKELEVEGLIKIPRHDSDGNLTPDYHLTRKGKRELRSLEREVMYEKNTFDSWIGLTIFPRLND